MRRRGSAYHLLSRRSALPPSLSPSLPPSLPALFLIWGSLVWEEGGGKDVKEEVVGMTAVEMEEKAGVGTPGLRGWRLFSFFCL